MLSATITFVNGKTITVSENDFLVPIIRKVENGQGYMGKLDPVEVTADTNSNVVPKIMDALCSCDFFATAENLSVVYQVSAVFSVEQE